MAQETNAEDNSAMGADRVNARVVLLAAAVLASVTVVGGGLVSMWRTGAAAQQATQHMMEINEVSGDLRVLMGELSTQSGDILAQTGPALANPTDETELNVNPAAIDQVEQVNAQFDATLARFGELVQGDPQEAALFAQLDASRDITRQWGEEFFAALRADDAMEAAALLQDPALMEAGQAFGMPFEQLLENAQNSAEAAYERGDRASRRVFLISGAGSILVILLWGAVAFDWFRQTRRAHRRANEITVLNNELEARVADRTRELEDALVRAEAASVAKSQFLASMSHELRTPLNGVLGMTSVLLSSKPREDQQQMLEIVESSGRTLLSLVNDILDHARLDAGALEIKTEPFELDDVLERTLKVYAVEAERKGVALELAIDDSASGGYVGDETRVGQVVNNLLSNAVKFTDSGEVRLSAASGEEGLLITVSDTGCGVAEDRLANIFDRFTQADSSTRRRHAGTGLGLALAKQLVEAMGGEIGAESRPGEGSTFWLALPLERAGAPRTAVAADQTAAA